MLSSPPYGALCTKYTALIAEMQKRKGQILCYSEFRAKAFVRQSYSLSVYLYKHLYLLHTVYDRIKMDDTQRIVNMRGSRDGKL